MKTVEINKTQLKERGWTDGLIRRLLPPPAVEERHSSTYGSYTIYLWNKSDVRAAERTAEWRKAQARRKATVKKLQVYREVDLLAAVFTVNRAAKRQRDLAQKYYQQNMHGFAGSSKNRKRKYYDLKDMGIMAAHQAGRLVCTFRHGGLYLWQGEGYSFHSTLKPKSLDVPELPLQEGEAYLFVEAKPMGSKEPRLRDAIQKLETLQGYPEPDAALYERAPSPEHNRQPRSITCWNCGLTGHVASECPEEESEVS
jgi:hypothetical protein